MSSEEQQQVREKFREQFESDRGAGIVRGVADYQNEYPGHWDLVAKEFKKLGGIPESDGIDLEAPTMELDPAALAAAAASIDDIQDVPDDLRRLGPYKLLRELGMGG
ncbi:MAG: hypothetical protein ACYTDX_10625, partial [Planctomycetota bacterium]